MSAPTELFSMHCPTCQAKLKVRDERAIGQILKCPKCASMVMVEDPRSSDEKAAAPAASPTPNEPAPTSSGRGESHGAEAGEGPRPDRERFKTNDPVAPSAWESDSARKNRIGLIYAMLGIIGLGVAIGLGMLLVGGQETQVSQGRSDDSSDARSEPAGKADPASDPARESEPSDPLAADAQPDPQPAESAVDAAPESVGSPEASQGSGASAEASGTEVKANAAEQGKVTSPASAATAQSADPDKSDPDKSDTSASSPEIPPGFEPPAQAATTSPSLEEIEKQLSDPRTLAGDRADVGTESPPPTAPPLDVSGRLNLTLESIRCEQVPLHQFLATCSKLLQVPITLDLKAAARREVSLSQPITVNLQETSGRLILAAALKPLALQPQAGKYSILISDELGESSEQIWEFGSNAEAKGVETLVGQTIDPIQWQAQGGAYELSQQGRRIRVVAPERTRREVERLVRRRVADQAATLPQGVPLRDRILRCRGRLTQTLVANFLAPTPLSEVLDYLSQEASLGIVVDWESLGRSRISPLTEVTLEADDVTADEALRRLLQPLGASFHIVDGESIGVAATDVLQNLWITDVHSTVGLKGLPARSDEILQRIRSELGEAMFVDQGGTAGLAYDRMGDQLFAFLPLSQHLQLTLLLDQWRKENTKP